MTRQETKQNKFCVFLRMVLRGSAILSLFFIWVGVANGAQLNLVSQSQEIGVNQKFYVDLMLDAEGSDINAAQGTINFSSDILKFDSLSDGDSIITFWAERPRMNAEPVRGTNAEISFSGVIPGGFSGVLSPYYQGTRPGKILRLYFIAKAQGNAVIKLTNAKVLLNDGQGTEVPLTISNFSAYVKTSADKQFPISNQIPKDIESPEDFRPEIVSDPNLFSGKHTLVWIAKDKGSGIDYYEVAEQRGNITQNYLELPWQTVESPHVLKDQKLKSYIYVKAVDRAENIRIVYLPPSYISWYKKPLVDIIVGLALITVVLLGIWLWRKLKSRK